MWRRHKIERWPLHNTRELIAQGSPALSQRRVRSVDIAGDQPSLDITAGELGASVTGCPVMDGWRQDTEGRMGGGNQALDHAGLWVPVSGVAHSARRGQDPNILV